MFLACLEVLKGVGKKTFLLGQSKSELVSTTTAAELEPRVSHKADESFTCCRWLSKTSSDHKIDETFKLCQISGFMTEASIFRLSQLNVVVVAVAAVVANYRFSTNVITTNTRDFFHFREQLHDTIAIFFREKKRIVAFAPFGFFWVDFCLESFSCSAEICAKREFNFVETRRWRWRWQGQSDVLQFWLRPDPDQEQRVTGSHLEGQKKETVRYRSRNGQRNIFVWEVKCTK